ncbi:MAG: hypothetical protein IPJ74_25195 [Saprospiraceae bacterium]|nr:hypothetical protein [Saprospiraceae bacterium]
MIISILLMRMKFTGFPFAHHADAESEDSYVFTPPISIVMKAEFPEVKNYMRISTSPSIHRCWR